MSLPSKKKVKRLAEKLLETIGAACLVFLLLLVFTATVSLAGTAPMIEKQYRLAKAYYHNLAGRPESANLREDWRKGMAMVRKVNEADTTRQLEPECLFLLGSMAKEAYDRVKDPQDRKQAVTNLEKLALKYPSHDLADDALYTLALLKRPEDEAEAAKNLTKIIDLYPSGDMADLAAKELANLKGGGKPAGKTQKTSKTGVALKSIRHWSTSDYSRVVVETSEPVSFKECLLPQSNTSSRRLYVDFKNTNIAPALTNSIPIQDGLLKKVRGAQFNSETVRVVLDIQSIRGYKVFSLNDPFRVVIDVHGEEGKGEEGKVPGKNPPTQKMPSLAQQLGLGVGKIILDPGHGGKDPGALGKFDLKEKDLVLAVAKKTAARLKGLGCEVVLTRKDDVFLPLEERTAIANTERGDLFISLHANSAPSPDVAGIETYFLDFTTNEDAMRVAARENSTSTRTMSDLQMILSDLMQNNKIKESAILAEHIQGALTDGLSRKFKDITNLGVKKAPFYVLIGAQMPAILAEISFISNPVEAQRLTSDENLDALANYLSVGVRAYITENNLAVLPDRRGR